MQLEETVLGNQSVPNNREIVTTSSGTVVANGILKGGSRAVSGQECIDNSQNSKGTVVAVYVWPYFFMQLIST